MRVQWRQRTTGELDHELIWLAVSATSIAGATVWLALALPWPKCLFHAVTGLPCLTCGSTRSMLEILRGDFLGAIRWNPLAFIAFCTLVIFDLYAVVTLAGGTARVRIVEWTLVEKKAARITAVVVLVLNWAYLIAHRGRF
jgi:hypothetical protein